MILQIFLESQWHFPKMRKGAQSPLHCEPPTAQARDKTRFKTHGKSSCEFWLQPTLEKGQALHCPTHKTHPEGRAKTWCPGCPISGSLTCELSATPFPAGTSSVPGFRGPPEQLLLPGQAPQTCRETQKLTQRCPEMHTPKGKAYPRSRPCYRPTVPSDRDHPDLLQQPSFWGTPGLDSYSPKRRPSG